MSDNDDILNLGPDEPEYSGPNRQSPANGNGRNIQGARPSTAKESAQKRLYKRLPWMIVFLLVSTLIILFIVKMLIDEGIHGVMHGPSAAHKAKPLDYASQQAEINNIKQILQQQENKKAAGQAQTPPVSGHIPAHHGASFGSGIPNTGPGPHALSAAEASAAAKAAQIAASPLVSLTGTQTQGQTQTRNAAYAPNSPQAIQAKIARLKAEERRSYANASDQNLGIGRDEKLALEAAGAGNKNANASSGQGSAESAWQKSHSGTAGYGKVIPTLPKLQGVALYQGTIIPAETVTRLDTQVPGQIIAQVTRTVYGQSGVVAIPAGSRLVGSYDGNVFNGRNRVLMSFSRVIFPGGREIALQGMNATGPKGAGGIDGTVHTHFWTDLGASLLVALITDGVDSIPNPNSQASGNTYIGTSGTSPTQAGAQVLQNEASQLLAPYQNIQPTITLPPATPFRILVNKTILLPAH